MVYDMIQVEGEHLVTIELQEELKEILENDFNLVKTKHKVSPTPAVGLYDS